MSAEIGDTGYQLRVCEAVAGALVQGTLVIAEAWELGPQWIYPKATAEGRTQ